MHKVGDKVIIKEGMHSLEEGSVGEVVEVRTEVRYVVRGISKRYGPEGYVPEKKEIVQTLFEGETEAFPRMPEIGK
jgi:hypothetical protein